MIDEGEASESKIYKTLNMFRSASSGATALRGTSDQKGIDYTLRFCGLLTGIIPIQFNQADNGRFLKLELEPLTKEKKEQVSDEDKKMFYNEAKLRELGHKMQKFMVANYKELLEINEIVRSLIIEKTESDRYAATFGIIVSCSYLALEYNGTIDFDSIKKYVDEFDFTEEVQRSKVKDHEELLENILIREVFDDFGKSVSVLHHIFKTYYAFKVSKQIKDFKHFNSMLGRYGMRVVDDTDDIKLLVDTSRNTIRSLLKGTRFEKGDIFQMLKRVNGAEVVNEAKSIGGVQKRNCIQITLDQKVYNFKKYAEHNIGEIKEDKTEEKPPF